jgi:maltooligosyltrehalose trehalohydrolase
LIEAVREGRRAEFAAFAWQGEHPDPQSETTFLRSKLDHALRNQAKHRVIYDFYRELLRLRKSVSALRHLNKNQCQVTCLEEKSSIAIRRWFGDEQALTVLHFGQDEAVLELEVPEGTWMKRLDSSDEKWLGPGSPLPPQIVTNGTAALRIAGKSVVVLTRTV